MSVPILEVKDLKKYYPIRKGFFNKQVAVKEVVGGVSLSIGNGETVAIVGESGCGKSVLSRIILGLEDPTEGKILYEGEDFATMSHERLKQTRYKMGMIFQDSLGSLHPRMTVEKSLIETLKLVGNTNHKEAHMKVIDTLKRVGLDPLFVTRYPHQLSGGQRQRVSIARSLIVDPKLIIADEPISALDVSLQAQVLNLIMDLQDELNLSMLFIAHDLAVVRQIAKKIMIMYCGQIVESADNKTIYRDARHPYTKVLLKAAPSILKGINDASFDVDLKVGDIPDPAKLPKGCAFCTKCTVSDSICEQEKPVPVEVSPGHIVVCHKVKNGI